MYETLSSSLPFLILIQRFCDYNFSLGVEKLLIYLCDRFPIYEHCYTPILNIRPVILYEKSYIQNSKKVSRHNFFSSFTQKNKIYPFCKRFCIRFQSVVSKTRDSRCLRSRDVRMVFATNFLAELCSRKEKIFTSSFSANSFAIDHKARKMERIARISRESTSHHVHHVARARNYQVQE